LGVGCGICAFNYCNNDDDKMEGNTEESTDVASSGSSGVKRHYFKGADGVYDTILNELMVYR